MAGRAHVVEVPAEIPPWPLAFEVAASTPPGSWALVGGLMVHVHALRAGIEATRPTNDIDLLLNIGANSVSHVAGPLTRLGFVAVDPSPGNPIHRFTRGEEDVVDVMVARDVRAHALAAAPAAALARRSAGAAAARHLHAQLDRQVGDRRGSGRARRDHRQGRRVRGGLSQPRATPRGPRRPRRGRREPAHPRPGHSHPQGSPASSPGHPVPGRGPAPSVASARLLRSDDRSESVGGDHHGVHTMSTGDAAEQLPRPRRRMPVTRRPAGMPRVRARLRPAVAPRTS